MLPIADGSKPGNAAPPKDISELLRKGNVPLAEILLRARLKKEPNNPEIFYLLGQIASAINLPQFALHYFGEAVKLAPGWPLPQINRDRISQLLAENQSPSAPGLQKTDPAKPAEKFILIKAWGFGFWSDVTHVLSQLLIAELTGRTPVVHWGENSLFGDDTGANAFEFYFDALSKTRVADLQNENFDYWPPKWDRSNLTEGEINKWSGPYSRIAGLYLLGREERVVVSDFYTPVIDLLPWIPKEHHLYGLSVDQVWLYLVRQYLHPKKDIMDEVDSFYQKHLGSPDFLAVHMRGSDKMFEVKNIDETNIQYQGIIDRYLAAHDFQRIFLMTDDTRVLDFFRKTYGNKIIATDCQRTSSTQGLHHQDAMDRRRLGIEVMVDAYLAARAKVFVGNGLSNPSLIVRYLKDWPEGCVNLVCQNRFHTSNEFIHDW